jgi:hypothetical protein
MGRNNKHSISVVYREQQSELENQREKCKTLRDRHYRGGLHPLAATATLERIPKKSGRPSSRSLRLQR